MGRLLSLPYLTLTYKQAQPFVNTRTIIPVYRAEKTAIARSIAAIVAPSTATQKSATNSITLKLVRRKVLIRMTSCFFSISHIPFPFYTCTKGIGVVIVQETLPPQCEWKSKPKGKYHIVDDEQDTENASAGLLSSCTNTIHK